MLKLFSFKGQKGVLLEPEARELLELANFDIPEFLLANNPADGAEKYQKRGWTSVAAKLIAPDIIHRRQVNGIQLNITGEREVRSSIDFLLKEFPK